MKLLLAFLLLTLCNTFAESRLPQIVCRDARGNPFPLKLDRFAMEVELFGDLAETTFTLTFRNESNRQLEGDFLLPLPPHANISGYALEVNGQFREAVAVEKKRAKLAYETIKRRGIDPGIVEKEANNLYRTRIFPIERNSTKSLRISYLEYLTIDGHAPYRPLYEYPINLTSKVGEISILIKNPDGAVIKCEHLEFLKSNNGAVEAILKDRTLTTKLSIESATPHQPSALLSDGAFPTVAYLTFNKAAVPEWGGSPEEPFGPTWDSPKKIKILWDASRSMAGTDFTKTFQYFDAFFTKVKTAEIQLHLLRNTETKADEFQIVNGNWSKLKSALEAIEYDGSSFLQGMEGLHQDLTILVTDGKATRWPDKVNELNCGRPFIALTTANALNPVLRNLAQRSGGQSILINTTDTKVALRQTLQKSFHIRSSQRRIEFIPLPSQPPFVYRYLAKGSRIDLEKLQVAVGDTVQQKLTLKQSKAPKKILQRLSGIATLDLLEKQNAPAADIITHCKEHTLASDHTSLIVLEFFADHLAFQIPPPEPELRRKYESRLAEFKKRLDHSLAQVWAEALNRHRHQFPGIEAILFEDLRRIEIHNEAQARVFDPEQLDANVTQAFQNWEKEAKALIAERRQNQKNDAWIQKAVQMRNKAGELTGLRSKGKTPLAVSVRGFVRNPGTLEFDKSATLKEALAKSSPLTKAGYAAVSFYRSGRKVTYNTQSKEFQDFELLPGDMVVVHDHDFRRQLRRSQSDGFGGFSDFSFDNSDDPFASDLSADEEVDYSSEPAVLPEPKKERRSEQLTLGLQSFGASLGGNDNTKHISLDPVPIAIRALQLFEEGKQLQARQHLSNLRELFPDNPSARRLEGYVFLQWGETAKAQSIFAALLRENPNDHLTAKLSADRHRLRDNSEQAARLLSKYLDNLQSRTDFAAAAILLLDRNQLIENPSGAASKSELPKDLRIVVTNIHPDPSFQLSVSDPTGFTTRDDEMSPTGVANHSSIGLHEITDREGLKGSYTLTARCDRDQLLEITIYRNFSTEKEEISRKSITLPASTNEKMTFLDTIQIQ